MRILVQYLLHAPVNVTVGGGGGLGSIPVAICGGRFISSLKGHVVN